MRRSARPSCKCPLTQARVCVCVSETGRCCWRTRFGGFCVLRSLAPRFLLWFLLCGGALRYRGGRASWLSNVAATKALTAEVWGDWWDLLRTCSLPWPLEPPPTPPPRLSLLSTSAPPGLRSLETSWKRTGDVLCCKCYELTGWQSESKCKTS